MRVEDQVVSLEYAKKLKELGVKQESLFYWKELEGKWYLEFCDKPWDEFKDRWYSAFTVGELGNILPAYFIQKDEYYNLRMYKISDSFMLEYFNRWDKLAVFNGVGSNFADTIECHARAKTLIYLLENKVMQ